MPCMRKLVRCRRRAIRPVKGVPVFMPRGCKPAMDSFPFRSAQANGIRRPTPTSCRGATFASAQVA
jgi:hypothetical protein